MSDHNERACPNCGSFLCAYERCDREGGPSRAVDSDSKLDLDDVAAGHPVAMRELAEMRGALERCRKMAIVLTADSDEDVGGLTCCLCGEGREFSENESEANADIGTCPHTEGCPLSALLPAPGVAQEPEGDDEDDVCGGCSDRSPDEEDHVCRFGTGCTVCPAFVPCDHEKGSPGLNPAAKATEPGVSEPLGTGSPHPPEGRPSPSPERK